ncbi:MAG: FabA/FabZ family ACP-dehydratase [Pricia sp.]
MDVDTIIAQLPYSKPFLFVEQLLEVDKDGVRGSFTFSRQMDFYQGHFKGHPVTPGVILTECCAQIGVVCLGIYLLSNGENPKQEDRNDQQLKNIKIGLSSSQMEFLLPVFPDEKVTVTSQKLYFRFNKLKCAVKMHNAAGKLVCKGEIAGMIQTGVHH